MLNLTTTIGGHFGRFHLQYYPWGYPDTYYYDSAPSVEVIAPDSDDQVNQGYQDQTPNAVQPKVIKILPDGTITNNSTPTSDDDSSTYDDD